MSLSLSPEMAWVRCGTRLYRFLIFAFLPILVDVLHIYQLKIVNEYDQEIPQSQTADNPVAP